LEKKLTVNLAFTAKNSKIRAVKVLAYIFELLRTSLFTSKVSLILLIKRIFIVKGGRWLSWLKIRVFVGI
jgi:hypothetical protein